MPLNNMFFVISFLISDTSQAKNIMMRLRGDLFYNFLISFDCLRGSCLMKMLVGLLKILFSFGIFLFFWRLHINKMAVLNQDKILKGIITDFS